MSKKSRWAAGDYNGKVHLYDRLSRMDFVPLCDGGPLASYGTVGQYTEIFYRRRGIAKACLACIKRRDEISIEEHEEIQRLREIESAAQGAVISAETLLQALQALKDKDQT